MTKQAQLVQDLQTHLADAEIVVIEAHQEVTLVCAGSQAFDVLSTLKSSAIFDFDQLIDVCGVDYLQYGKSDWNTRDVTLTGFSRAVGPSHAELVHDHLHTRFSVVYHLLSTTKNQRIRVKAMLPENQLFIASVQSLWNSASWFEREAYDLYGILFDGHPDLRRILTDYGFIGHPFRKDFPTSGHVEMRYDAALQKVIYEPVDIEPRVTVPRVIRQENRYLDNEETFGG